MRWEMTTMERIKEVLDVLYQRGIIGEYQNKKGAINETLA